MVHSFPTRRSSDLCRRTSTVGVRTSSFGHAYPRRVRSEEHTSELQSHHPTSYAVFCLKKKKTKRPGSCSTTPRLSRPGLATMLTGALSSFFFNDTATTEIYTGWYALSLHDALPI